MKQEHMRLADFWVGGFVCWLLTRYRRVLDGLLPKRAYVRPKKIVFIKLIEQGATVIAYDALKRAVELVGRPNVYFCVFPENRAILDLIEVLPRENVITLRHDRLWSLVWDSLKFFRTCRREGIEATVDMEFFARAPAVLAFLTGARVRVGLHRFTAEAPYRGDLMTHRIPQSPYMHTALAYRLLVEAAMRDPDEHRLLGQGIAGINLQLPRFQSTERERARVGAVMRESLGKEPGWPIVLLNPNAGDLLPIRKWPLERFQALAHRILAIYPAADILITGAPSERASAEDFARMVDHARVASVAGKTSLRELFALYETADVLVTNDSGPGHFSSMTDIHAIVMFGPETPALFGPLGEHSHAVWNQQSCSPCVSAINHRNSPCVDSLCMKAISVDEVLGLVAECVEERRESLRAQCDVEPAGKTVATRSGPIVERVTDL